METKKNFGPRAWDWIGHLSTVSWLADLAKVAPGPIVGILTYITGAGANIPFPYQIAAACTAAGTTMWLVNQITVFFRRYREGYAYGLAYEGVTLGLNPNSAEATLQLSVQFRNVSQRPMRYKVERFDVVVEDRTIPNPEFVSNGGIIAHGVGRMYSYPSFKI